MARVVLDTNVLVSGLLSEQGAPGRILDLVLSGELRLLLDERILSEYRDVLKRSELAIPPVPAAEVLQFLADSAERIVASPWPLPLPDPDDEPFLAVAGAGEADALITGNLRHFPARVRAGVRVCGAREFLEWLAARAPEVAGESLTPAPGAGAGRWRPPRPS